MVILFVGVKSIAETIYQLDKANECMKHIQLENQHPIIAQSLFFLVTKLQSQKGSGLSG